MNITSKRTKIILDYLLSDNSDFFICDKCADYPHDIPDAGILIGNWNNVSDRLQDYLDQAGFDLFYDDEYIIDYNDSTCYRICADSYDWKPLYILNDWTNGEIIPIKDIEQDPDLADEYIIDYLMNNDRAVSKADIEKDLDRLGFKSIEDQFESGFHYGQTDDPRKILKHYNDLGYDLVFSGYDSSQFYITFKAHIRPVNYEKDQDHA